MLMQCVSNSISVVSVTIGLEQYLVLKAVMYYYEPLLYKKVRLLMENSADVGVRFYEYLFKCMDEDRSGI